MEQRPDETQNTQLHPEQTGNTTMPNTGVEPSQKPPKLTFVLIAVGALLVIGGAAYWFFAKDKDAGSKQTTNQTQNQTATEDTVPQGYKKYTDPDGKFSFIHPDTWESTYQDRSTSERLLVALTSPTLKEKIETGYGPEGGERYYEGPLWNVSVSHWPDVNEVVKDESFEGKKTYANLADFLDNATGSFIQKTGTITVNGRDGHEVIVGGLGSSYGIMFETSDGVYLLEFDAVDSKASLTDLEQGIIDSFTLN